MPQNGPRGAPERAWRTATMSEAASAAAMFSPSSASISRPSKLRRTGAPAGRMSWCFRRTTSQARADRRSSRWNDEPVAQVGGLAAAPLVVGLERGETIVAPRRLLDLVAVHPGRVLAEDGALDRSVGRPELGKAVLLAHVLGDLQPAQALDLPLRRAGPHRVG